MCVGWPVQYEYVVCSQKVDLVGHKSSHNLDLAGLGAPNFVRQQNTILRFCFGSRLTLHLLETYTRDLGSCCAKSAYRLHNTTSRCFGALNLFEVLQTES